MATRRGFRIIRVGDQIAFPLTFRDEQPAPAELIQTIDGIARPLLARAADDDAATPVRMDVEGAALYWSPATAVEGPVHVEGTVISNAGEQDWDDFPATRGIVRRVRMEWNEIVHDGRGVWRRTDRPAHYEDVAASYLPRIEVHEVPETDADRDRVVPEPLRRRASARTRSAVYLGWSIPSRPPPGIVKTAWTGVLLDFEPLGVEAE